MDELSKIELQSLSWDFAFIAYLARKGRTREIIEIAFQAMDDIEQLQKAIEKESAGNGLGEYGKRVFRESMKKLI